MSIGDMERPFKHSSKSLQIGLLHSTSHGIRETGNYQVISRMKIWENGLDY